MRIKKGFTLAEILIVLVILGVIAVMTIPTMIKGVADAQFKAAYKKAYSTISNFMIATNLTGQTPKRRSAEQATLFYGVLAKNLEIISYTKENPIDGGELVGTGNSETLRKFYLKAGDEKVLIGGGYQRPSSEETILEGVAPGENKLSTWMNTTDGISYAMMITADDNEKCPTKAEIASKQTVADALSATCILIVVDVNGLYKGPNRLEVQDSTDGADIAASGTKLKRLANDRYYIYLGSDGATAGPANTSVSGRIVNE